LVHLAGLMPVIAALEGTKADRPRRKTAGSASAQKPRARRVSGSGWQCAGS